MKSCAKGVSLESTLVEILYWTGTDDLSSSYVQGFEEQRCSRQTGRDSSSSVRGQCCVVLVLGVGCVVEMYLTDGTESIFAVGIVGGAAASRAGWM